MMYMYYTSNFKVKKYGPKGKERKKSKSLTYFKNSKTKYSVFDQLK